MLCGTDCLHQRLSPMYLVSMQKKMSVKVALDPTVALLIVHVQTKSTECDVTCSNFVVCKARPNLAERTDSFAKSLGSSNSFLVLVSSLK